MTSIIYLFHLMPIECGIKDCLFIFMNLKAKENDYGRTTFSFLLMKGSNHRSLMAYILIFNH